MSEALKGWTHLDKEAAAMNMRMNGSGFTSRLADAWLYADDTNKQKLEQAFPDYFEQFDTLNTDRGAT